jgi:hypothetical protein
VVVAWRAVLTYLLCSTLRDQQRTVQKADVKFALVSLCFWFTFPAVFCWFGGGFLARWGGRARDAYLRMAVASCDAEAGTLPPRREGTRNRRRNAAAAEDPGLPSSRGGRR